MKSLVRIGLGYDLHRLVSGRPFMLGGEAVPAAVGPLGHSDGDVLVHALIDALLGAMGLGNIGERFPDTDERWRGARSVDLLALVMEEARTRGWGVGNLDAVVILERPKLSGHLGRIRASLATTLGVAPDRVNIKPKTNEGCGELGRGEAVAAWVTVLLMRQEVTPPVVSERG